MKIFPQLIRTHQHVSRGGHNELCLNERDGEDITVVEFPKELQWLFGESERKFREERIVWTLGLLGFSRIRMLSDVHELPHLSRSDGDWLSYLAQEPKAFQPSQSSTTQSSSSSGNVRVTARFMFGATTQYDGATGRNPNDCAPTTATAMAHAAVSSPQHSASISTCSS